jgi:hypothetical protein
VKAPKSRGLLCHKKIGFHQTRHCLFSRLISLQNWRMIRTSAHRASRLGRRFFGEKLVKKTQFFQVHALGDKTVVISPVMNRLKSLFVVMTTYWGQGGERAKGLAFFKRSL